MKNKANSRFPFVIPAPQEYNDKPVTPSQGRLETAFRRYLILGSFSEIQMIAPGSQDKTMYQCFTSPNLLHSVTLTVERIGAKKAKVTWRENGEAPADEKGRKVWADTKLVEHVLPTTWRTGDADLIKAAQEAQCTLVSEKVREYFH